MQKRTSKRKRPSKAVPVLGLAGLSFSLASGASAAPAANLPVPKVDPSHEVFLAEEEISDVSLATFYVFDKENTGSSRPGLQLVRGGSGRRLWLQRLRRWRLRRLRRRRLRRLRRLWRCEAVAASASGAPGASS